MKKILAALLVIVFVFALVACDKKQTLTNIDSMFKDKEQTSAEFQYPANQEGADASHPATLEPGTYKIEVFIYKFDDTFMTNYRNHISDYFKSLETDDVKFDVNFNDGNNNMATQIEQIDTAIANGANALIVNMVEPTSAATVTEKAKAANIPVIYINREPASTDTAAWDYAGKVTYVGADARQSGTIEGNIIAKLPNKGDIDGDGTVRFITLVGDPGNVDAQYRSIFSIKALTDAGITWMRLFEQRGNWDRAQGQELTSTAIAQFGKKIDVIFANNDDMALGAIEAVKAAGWKVGTDVYIVGVDATDPARDALKAGDLTGTVLNDHIGQSETAVNAVLQALAGNPLKQYYIVDYLAVTE